MDAVEATIVILTIVTVSIVVYMATRWLKKKYISAYGSASTLNKVVPATSTALAVHEGMTINAPRDGMTINAPRDGMAPAAAPAAAPVAAPAAAPAPAVDQYGVAIAPEVERKAEVPKNIEFEALF